MARHALVKHLGLLLVIALAVALRSGGILDDRTWYDEDYVLLEASGVRYIEPWPTEFVRSQLEWSSSVSAALYNLAHFDAYPPLLTLVLRVVRNAWNPIIAARLVLLAINVLLLIGVYAWASRVATRTVALVATAYVSVIPLLVQSSQMIKWAALAPALATLAALLLLVQTEDRRWRFWVTYVAMMTLLLHTHYFCASVVVAHGVFVLLFARQLLGRWLLALGALTVLCSPWYLLGLPQQSNYVAWFFKAWLASRSFDSWYQPLTVRSFLAGLGYNLTAIFGLQPSPIRVRFLLPLLIPLGWLVGRACSAPEKGVRLMSRLALVTYATAYVGQSLYAAHLGHTTPLTAAYFVPWLPLLVFAAVAGALAVRPQPWGRGALVVAAAIALANSVTLGYPHEIAGAHSMNRYEEVARALRQIRPPAAIVFRTDRDAKMTNLFYAGDLLQCIATAADWRPPSGATRLVFVGSRWAVPVRSPGPTWSCDAGKLIGETRLDRCERVVR